nr:MAG TPA: hypothetical protein [Caudoviricetes sp.]
MGKVIKGRSRVAFGQYRADGFVQACPGLVRHIQIGSQLQRLQEQIGIKTGSGQQGALCGIRHFFRQNGLHVTVAQRHHPAMAQRMTPDFQRTGIITGVDTPQHHVHQHVILLRTSGSQHALRPGGILRQKLHLDCRLFHGGLDTLKAAAVFCQLQQHQVIAGRMANTAALPGGLFGLNAQAVLPCGTQAHALLLSFCFGGFFHRRRLHRSWLAEVTDSDVFDQGRAAVVFNHIRFVDGFEVLNPVTFRVVDNRTAAGVLLPVDGQVIQTGDQQGISREERRTHRLQAAHAFLADNQIGGDFLAVFLLFVNQREILIGQQLAAADNNQLIIILIHHVDQLVNRIHHHGVQVGIVAALAHLYRACGGGAVLGGAAHNVVRRVFADFLQPALIHVLQQRVFCAVGGFGALHSVKADHNAVQRLALDNGVTDTHLEVLKFRPQVQLCVGQHRVKVGLFAFIFHVLHQHRIGRFALFGGGVGGSGNGGANAQAKQLAGLFRNRRDVNQRQKSGGLLDLVFQRLLHGRVHGELAGKFFHFHVVQACQLLQVGVKGKAGILFHRVLCSFSNWSGCLPVRHRPARAGGNLYDCLHGSAAGEARQRRPAAPAARIQAQKCARPGRTGIYQCARSGSAARWRPAQRLCARLRNAHHRSALFW